MVVVHMCAVRSRKDDGVTAMGIAQTSWPDQLTVVDPFRDRTIDRVTNMLIHGQTEVNGKFHRVVKTSTDGAALTYSVLTPVMITPRAAADGVDRWTSLVIVMETPIRNRYGHGPPRHALSDDNADRLPADGEPREAPLTSGCETSPAR